MSAASDLAARCVGVAVDQFEADGTTDSRVVLEAPTFVLFAHPVGEGDDFPAWAARVISVLGGIGGVTAAAMMSEAWYTVVVNPSAADEPPHLEPGELARREAAGDTEVKTSLMIAAADGADTVTRVLRPEVADDGSVTWDDDGGHIMTGRVPRLVAEALDYSRRVTPPEDKTPIGMLDLGEYAKALHKMSPMLDADITLVGIVGMDVPEDANHR